MKKIIIASVLAFSLSGCASGLSPQSVGTAINNINSTVTEVQTIAQEVCKFVPATKTVTDLLSQFVSGFNTAQSIAQRICDAVAPAGGASLARRARSGPPTVNGVVIRGRFVR